jgi:hypothetical protein
MQRSYNAEKFAAETDGADLEQAGSPTLAATPPLTTLAHVGEAREMGWRGEGFDGWRAYDPRGGGSVAWGQAR